MSELKKKPSKLWYLLAVICLVFSLLIMISAGVVGYRGIVSFVSPDLQRVIIPGSETLSFKEPGRKTIFYEYTSQVKGRVFSSRNQSPEMTITVTDLQSQSIIPVVDPKGSTTYNLPSRSGYSIASFNVVNPNAKYNINVTYPDNVQNQSSVVLAIGKLPVLPFVLALLSIIFGGILGFGLAIAGTVIIIITIVRAKQASA
ncbi:hypothetical protein KS4_09830 [Poriferisphaera corsica]|uniref:Uncharacterized protein n=1 Tax=Poriferisphaera corsica TaxID=2528020 RepID=A0A517YRU5_9BACT|nr:hypothetical protein [Poriferisphaera corsica]QDU32944.1 hypothetical protein KS4_09830 [Poriferisphaera corsica]